MLRLYHIVVAWLPDFLGGIFGVLILLEITMWGISTSSVVGDGAINTKFSGDVSRLCLLNRKVSCLDPRERRGT